MGIAQTAVRSIRSIWSHGEEEEFERDDADSYDPEPRSDPAGSDPRNDPRPDMRHDSPLPRGGGGMGGSNVRRVGPPVPLRASSSRDKQIYTIKPHGLEEASAAADFLKTGSAVVVNLDDVDKMTAVRIIDFMSGVCYGLDSQGHAMKLGDTIFLFTPGDFEITSDEPDYNENPEHFFRDVPTTPQNSTPALQSTPQSPAPAAAAPPAPMAAAPSAPEAAVIERTVIGRPGGAAAERVAVERPSVAPRPWER